ncbi:tumor necrosis factor ligand superfamily member 14 [Colossoma macropomum]|uniref:tumor necrosis factor ligand superfamily member 14 n=1 Tax=Colossoma macropomum TaxID=42526 RepID=UPI001863DFC5|nr:tumor necrosis factor ligand superfamily member 14 [Colossoma macropomum]XP_036413690.1 tumor necrosis factor ligand superfamily member 14 [Colossoma macropomum]
MMEAGPAGCPQVFVVDSQAPATLQPSEVRHASNKNKPYLLYLLVGLALLGVAIEAIFIYELYQPSAAQASSDTSRTAQRTGEKADWDGSSNEIPPIPEKKATEQEDKPAAFLQGLNGEVRADGVMQWQKDGLAPFIRGLEYKEGSLHIQKQGFYYVYSKVYFSETCSLFKHQVKRRSPRYNNAPTDLMQSLRYSCVGSQRQEQNRADVGNSFLGGVFLLYSGDSVYVQVNDSRVVRSGVYDNFFGVFMI